MECNHQPEECLFGSVKRDRGGSDIESGRQERKLRFQNVHKDASQRSVHFRLLVCGVLDKTQNCVERDGDHVMIFEMGHGKAFSGLGPNIIVDPRHKPQGTDKFRFVDIKLVRHVSKHMSIGARGSVRVEVTVSAVAGDQLFIDVTGHQKKAAERVPLFVSNVDHRVDKVGRRKGKIKVVAHESAPESD